MTIKTNQQKNAFRQQLITIVPFGVEEVIFPWGAHSITEYIQKTCDSIDVQLWDFHYDKFFKDLHDEHASLLRNLFFTLKPTEMETFFGGVTNPYLFLGFAACVGEDFFKITGGNYLPNRKYSRQLNSLQTALKDHLSKSILDLIKNSPAKTRIWGLSVYDRTLFNCLYIANLIKELDPESSVILGGDHFDFKNAEKVFKDISFVDGIVVGYGEEVMRQIIVRLSNGSTADELSIKGFVNTQSLQNQEKTNAINIPPNYEELQCKPLISYIQQNKPREIRVLSQRGCSWGKCSFCTQIDKDLFFPVSAEHLLEKVLEILEREEPENQSGTFTISFDSDENSIEMVIEFLETLGKLDYPDIDFEIILWFQVKMFRKKLAEALAKINPEKIHVHFMLNFESLNTKVLKTMKKGHSPLQAIEAAKAIQDTGHSFVSNYFNHFPLITSDSIAREAELLEKIAHLMIPPKGGGLVFPYGSNNRDSIYFNQRKYKVKIKHLRGDRWLKKVFGLDLPFNIWAYSYKERLSVKPERLLAATHYNVLKSNDDVHRPAQTASLNWGNKEPPLPQAIKSRLRHGNALMWNQALNLFRLSKKGRTLHRRKKMFDYFSEILETTVSEAVQEDSVTSTFQLNERTLGKESKIRKSTFAISNGKLYKDWNIPGKKEKLNRKLSAIELKMLRDLYWSRRYNTVIDAYKNEYSAAEIEQLLDYHIGIGSIIRFKNQLLSVVNDPEYWK